MRCHLVLVAGEAAANNDENGVGGGGDDGDVGWVPCSVLIVCLPSCIQTLPMGL